MSRFVPELQNVKTGGYFRHLTFNKSEVYKDEKNSGKN
jgi:hypothetical protein